MNYYSSLSPNLNIFNSLIKRLYCKWKYQMENCTLNFERSKFSSASAQQFVCLAHFNSFHSHFIFVSFYSFLFIIPRKNFLNVAKIFSIDFQFLCSMNVLSIEQMNIVDFMQWKTNLNLNWHQISRWTKVEKWKIELTASHIGCVLNNAKQEFV